MQNKRQAKGPGRANLISRNYLSNFSITKICVFYVKNPLF